MIVLKILGFCFVFLLVGCLERIIFDKMDKWDDKINKL